MVSQRGYLWWQGGVVVFFVLLWSSDEQWMQRYLK